MTRKRNRWRVAQAFDLTGVSNTAGAPLLRSLQGRESGMHASSGFYQAPLQIKKRGQRRGPPLQTTQGWGTRRGNGVGKTAKVGHPSCNSKGP
jgi:hypothetical protein